VWTVEFFDNDLDVIRLGLKPVTPVSFQEIFQLLPEGLRWIPECGVQVDRTRDVLNCLPRNHSVDARARQ